MGLLEKRSPAFLQSHLTYDDVLSGSFVPSGFGNRRVVRASHLREQAFEKHFSPYNDPVVYRALDLGTRADGVDS